MTRLTGTVDLEIPDQLSRELAVAVVGELDRVDFIGALADAVVRRMAGETGDEGVPSANTPGESVYEREPEPDPGAGPRRGAQYGDVTDGGLTPA